MKIDVTYEVTEGTRVDQFVQHLQTLAAGMSSVQSVALSDEECPYDCDYCRG